LKFEHVFSKIDLAKINRAQRKPVIAFTSDLMASAAYWLTPVASFWRMWSWQPRSLLRIPAYRDQILREGKDQWLRMQSWARLREVQRPIRKLIAFHSRLDDASGKMNG
jgi:hypothetical protein